MALNEISNGTSHSSQKIELNGALLDFHQTAEYQKIARQTEADVRAMGENAVASGAAILDEQRPLEERLDVFGRLLSATLLAYEHRGGYSVETGAQQLIHNFEEDTGLRGDEIARAFGAPSFKQFLQNKAMEPYVKMSFNNENKPIFTGQRFENEFLSQLLVEQEFGEANSKKKELDKRLDRAARMQAANLNVETIDARLRIYTCMHNIGACNKLKPYMDVQTEYGKVYGTVLNKAELKRIFGIGEALNVLREQCFSDVHVEEDPYRKGFLQVSLKRSLDEIKLEYDKVKEELANNPVNEDLGKLHRYRTDYLNRERDPRPKNKNKNQQTYSETEYVNKTPDFLNAGFALANDENESPRVEESERPATSAASAPPNKKVQFAEPTETKRPGRTTVRGPGTYSDDDGSDDEDEKPAARPSASNHEKKVVEPKSQIFQRVAINRQPAAKSSDEDDETNRPKDLTQQARTRPPPPNFGKPIERVEKSLFYEHSKPAPPNRAENSARPPPREPPNRQGPSVEQRPGNSRSDLTEVEGLDEMTSMVIHAYVVGYLKSINPSMHANTRTLVARVVAYLAKRNIKVKNSQVVHLIGSVMNGELSFSESKQFVSLAVKD